MKLWVRVGMEIEVSKDDLDNREAMVAAIKKGVVNGDTYGPECEDDERYTNEELIKEGVSLSWELWE